MKCTICHHPQRHDLDQALLAGNDTFAALKQKYGPSVSALWRHKKHLQEKMRRAEARLQNNLRQGSLFQFNAFLETARLLVRIATEAGNSRQALQAISAGTRILNFITKLDVKLDDDMVYRVLASPQWTTQDSLLPTDPQIITGSHQALADDLFFPCPAPPPGEADEDDADDEAEDDRDELEEIPPFWERTNPGAADPNILPLKNSPAPDPLPTSPPEIAICCFPLPVAPKNQREISAKLPQKSPCVDKFNEQYQLNMPCEKNRPKNSGVGRASEAPPAVKQAYTHPMEPPAQPNETRQTVFAPATIPAALDLKLPPGLSLDLLQQILPRLDQLPVTQRQTENQREITAKLPRQSPCLDKFNEQYQANIPCEKNRPRNSHLTNYFFGKRQTENGKLKTVFEKPETIFPRLRRIWAKIATASKYYCASTVTTKQKPERRPPRPGLIIG